MLIGMLLFGACRSEDVYKEGTVDTAETVTDSDGDGYFSDEDCDDNSSTIYPSAEELCDGVDNDCDGDIDEGVTSTFYLDNDGDGFGDDAETIDSCDVRLICVYVCLNHITLQYRYILYIISVY